MSAESIRAEAARRGVSLWQVRRDRGETSHPRGPDGRVQVGLRLPSELVERLRDEAANREVSMNWLATRALEDYLERLVPANEIQWTREARS